MRSTKTWKNLAWSTKNLHALVYGYWGSHQSNSDDVPIFWPHSSSEWYSTHEGKVKASSKVLSPHHRWPFQKDWPTNHKGGEGNKERRGILPSAMVLSKAIKGWREVVSSSWWKVDGMIWFPNEWAKELLASRIPCPPLVFKHGALWNWLPHKRIMPCPPLRAIVWHQSRCYIAKWKPWLH